MAHSSGARIYRRGRFWSIDARPYGGKRESIRNPADPSWPYSGERTEDEEIARRWSWDYVAFYRDGIRRRHLGLPPRPRRLELAFQAFLDDYGPSVAANTISGYKTARTHLYAKFTKDAYTDRITKDKLQEWANDLLRAGYEPGTLRTVLTSMSAFFSWIGGGNPATEVELPNSQEPEIRVWSEAEVQELYDAADWVDSHKSENGWPSAVLVVATYLNTGARQQEGFALDVGSLNEQSSSIRFWRQLDKAGRKFVPLKGRDAGTAFVLEEFWDYWPAYRTEQDLILGRADGRPMGYRSQKNLLQRVLDCARLYERWTAFHAFRHTYARRYLEGGGSLGELQSFLRHASISTTEKRYKHFKDSVALKLAHERFDFQRLRA